MIHLEMPEDVRKHVLRFQAELKIKKDLKKYSLQTTIYAMLREHAELTKKSENEKR